MNFQIFMELPPAGLFNRVVKIKVFTLSTHPVAAAAISRSTPTSLPSSRQSPKPLGRLNLFLLGINPVAPECIYEKRPVAFRMAPKKSIGKGKGKGVMIAEATLDDGWRETKCSDFKILSLVEECLLQPREIVQWRSALGQNRPYEKTDETVTFSGSLSEDLEFLLPTSFVVFSSIGGFKLIT